VKEYSSDPKAIYMRRWRKRNGPGAQRYKRLTNERNRALEQLAGRHPAELERLIAEEAKVADNNNTWWGEGEEEPGYPDG
jgi:hypothetical protein